MTYLKNSTQVKEVALGMLAGDTHLLEGCQKICRLRCQLEDPDNPLLNIFIAIDSETDHWPVGSARKYWAPNALAAADIEIDEYLAAAEVDILAACEAIAKAIA